MRWQSVLLLFSEEARRCARSWRPSSARSSVAEVSSVDGRSRSFPQPGPGAMRRWVRCCRNNDLPGSACYIAEIFSEAGMCERARI
jgi:hypothetical protein